MEEVRAERKKSLIKFFYSDTVVCYVTKVKHHPQRLASEYKYLGNVVDAIMTLSNDFDITKF